MFGSMAAGLLFTYSYVSASDYDTVRSMLTMLQAISRTVAFVGYLGTVGDAHSINAGK